MVSSKALAVQGLRADLNPSDTAEITSVQLSVDT